MKYNYLVHGIRLQSEFPCNSLQAQKAELKPDLNFVRGPVKPIAFNGEKSMQVMDDCIILDTGDGTRLCCNNDCTLTIDPSESITPSELEHLLLGWGIGLMLNQLGRLVLHGSALVFPGGDAAIISGPSGAGKSTLAAALVRQECLLLDDNLAPLDGTNLFPGAPNIKLWEDAMLRSGWDIGQVQSVWRNRDKYRQPVSQTLRLSQTASLKAIYVFEPTGGANLEFSQVKGRDRLVALGECLFLARMVWLKYSSETRKRLLQIAAEIPLFKILLPSIRPNEDRLAEALLQHWEVTVHGRHHHELQAGKD